MSDPPESPCIGICQLDVQRICLGCARTMDEIVAWPTATPRQRHAILAAARARQVEQGEVPREPEP